MGILHFLIVFNAVLALTCGANVVAEQPTPTTTTTTTTDSNITSTTLQPTTTSPVTPSPTKPTVPPTTKPTTKPTTTTSTTTTVKPSTTTVTTTTSSPAPPTPKPEPPKNVDPPTGDWRFNCTGTNKSIIAHMAVQIEVPYETLSNETWKAYVDIPLNASVNGFCDNTTESLQLKWDANNVVFNFKMNNSVWYVDSIYASVDMDNTSFPNKKNNGTLEFRHVGGVFNTTEKWSYKCDKLQTFTVVSPNNTSSALFHLRHLQLEPFADAAATGFANAVDCAPSTPDVVPIAAGCALAGLIIVVLVAYLIGRRRSQARGYLSMFTENKREEDYIPLKNLSCFN